MLALAPLLPPACLPASLPPLSLRRFSGHKCTKLSSENKLPSTPRTVRRACGRVRVRRGENRTEQKRRDGWMEPEQLCDRNLLRDGG